MKSYAYATEPGTIKAITAEEFGLAASLDDEGTHGRLWQPAGTLKNKREWRRGINLSSLTMTGAHRNSIARQDLFRYSVKVISSMKTAEALLLPSLAAHARSL